ncbi:MAG: hypothetical protein ACTSYI_12375 [Promethearchaeota archaeon]
MSQNQKNFIYCSECMHVYFEIPTSNECSICHNEISHENRISELDILICETCNHIYSIQRPEEIIPNFPDNLDHLCGCKNNCPTTSFLAIGQQQTYYGNIILADIYQCSNCGAISYRNLGVADKKCFECGSRYLQSLRWNSETHRIRYQCSNPNHGIRLKLRDLIERNNQLIDQQIIVINSKEQDLIKTYEEQEEFLKANKESNFLKEKFAKLKRKPTKFANKLQELNNWALVERKKLYTTFHPLGLRCAVFKEQKSENFTNLVNTGDGCEALTKIKVNKVVIAPDGTVIDKEPVKTMDESQQDNQVFVTPFSLVDSLQNQKHVSAFAQIIDYPHNKDEIKLRSLDNETIEKIPSAGIPELLPHQVILHIDIFIQPQKNDQYICINRGIIPLEFSQPDSKIYIGKEHFLAAYWSDPNAFQLYPFIFDNIISVLENKFHFGLERTEKAFYLIPNSEKFNNPVIHNLDLSSSKISEKIELKAPKKFSLIGYYPIDQENSEKIHKIQFQFELKNK